jgi:hypothetical protein
VGAVEIERFSLVCMIYVERASSTSLAIIEA